MITEWNDTVRLKKCCRLSFTLSTLHSRLNAACWVIRIRGEHLRTSISRLPRAETKATGWGCFDLCYGKASYSRLFLVFWQLSVPGQSLPNRLVLDTRSQLLWAHTEASSKLAFWNLSEENPLTLTIFFTLQKHINSFVADTGQVKTFIMIVCYSYGDQNTRVSTGS